MLKVSEFSKLGRVTVKALHLYDRLGLLVPAHTDEATGYRFYTLEQLSRLNRILALKDLGFSLSELRGLLDENPSPAELRKLLCGKQAELARRVAEGQERLTRVEQRLRQIEREGAPPKYDITVKELEPLTVASARGREAKHAGFIRFTYEVPELVERGGVRAVGPVMALFYHDEFRDYDFDVEVAVPVAHGTVLDLPTAAGGRLSVRELEGVPKAACLVWRGEEPLEAAYLTLGAWVAENGLRTNGPARELYLRGGEAGNVFECQYSVEAA